MLCLMDQVNGSQFLTHRLESVYERLNSGALGMVCRLRLRADTSSSCSWSGSIMEGKLCMRALEDVLDSSAWWRWGAWLTGRSKSPEICLDIVLCACHVRLLDSMSS